MSNHALTLLALFAACVPLINHTLSQCCRKDNSLKVTSINIMHNIEGESSPEDAVDGAKPGVVGKGMKKFSVHMCYANHSKV